MSKEAENKQRQDMGGFLSRGRILTEEDLKEEELAASSSSSSTTAKAEATTATPAKTPKSKPTLASRINSANRKPKPVPKEEEHTWSGTAPKIHELQEGEE